MPEIRFRPLQGLQNLPQIQGIKMQGMQNLVRNSFHSSAEYAKPCPSFSLDFCTGGKIVPEIQFALLPGMQ